MGRQVLPNAKRKGGAGQMDAYTPEIGEQICTMIIEGSTLVKMSDVIGVSTTTILNWLHKYEEFNKKYYLARQLQMELIIDGILVISDDSSEDWKEEEYGNGKTRIVVDHEHIARSRLKIDTRKWLAAKLYPKLYGDKIQVDAGKGLTTATLIIKNEAPDGAED